MGRKIGRRAALRGRRRISRCGYGPVFGDAGGGHRVVAIARARLCIRRRRPPGRVLPWSQRYFSGVRAYGPYRERWTTSRIIHHPEGQYGEAERAVNRATRQFMRWHWPPGLRVPDAVGRRAQERRAE
jgi:hypothetical protein